MTQDRRDSIIHSAFAAGIAPTVKQAGYASRGLELKKCFHCDTKLYTDEMHFVFLKEFQKTAYLCSKHWQYGL